MIAEQDESSCPSEPSRPQPQFEQEVQNRAERTGTSRAGASEAFISVDPDERATPAGVRVPWPGPESSSEGDEVFDGIGASGAPSGRSAGVSEPSCPQSAQGTSSLQHVRIAGQASEERAGVVRGLQAQVRELNLKLLEASRQMSSQSQSISELRRRQEEQMELLKAQHEEQLRMQREEQERALESLRRSQEQILSQQLSEFREQLRSAQPTPRAREDVENTRRADLRQTDLRRTDLGLSEAPRRTEKIEVPASGVQKSSKIRGPSSISLGESAKVQKAPPRSEATEVGVSRKARQLLVRQAGKITARLPLEGAEAVVSADRTRVRVRAGVQEVSLSVDPATAAAMRAQLAECGCAVRSE